MSAMAVTLVVIRHAKSDWSTPTKDQDRPLAKRGRKQAPKTGEWIGAHVAPIDLAVVSVAKRTRQTWKLIRDEVCTGGPTKGVEVRESVSAYTFDGRDLRELVAELPAKATTVALVSHNPAVEELVEALTGQWVPMPTSALAVIELEDWAVAGMEKGRLVAAGRPADDRWFVAPA